MTRVLIFDGPRGPKRFQLCWASVMAAGDGKGERSPVIIRKEARLQTVLETISSPAPSGTTEVPQMRALHETGGTIQLPQEDFDLLLQYSEKTAWSPQVSRDVVDLWDWLSAADKRD